MLAHSWRLLKKPLPAPPMLRRKSASLHLLTSLARWPACTCMALQTRQRLYEKDLDFSYKPFLSILGTGLVTADGAHWQKQRLLMAPALRIDMLDAIIPIANSAVERLCKNLEAFRGTGTPGEAVGG
jgi:cytochrome P450